MTLRLLLIAAVLATLSLAGCASTGFTPSSQTMPAARAALAPEYRIFYDALEDEGDWVLIEPYGFVFRPDVNFVGWQPYDQGFWVPSDAYGWVWISTEPFGWATYHYGRWLYDDYQGWVWVPGIDWGPAWVSWEITSDFVGWAPLSVPGAGPHAIPEYAARWAPISALAATDLPAHIVSPAQIQDRIADARPVRNTVERNGVLIERGPPFDLVEKRVGPLPRVRLADPTGGAEERPRAGGGASSDVASRIEAARRAGVQLAREAKVLIGSGGPPPARLELPRPVFLSPSAGAPSGGRPHAAPADTTRR